MIKNIKWISKQTYKTNDDVSLVLVKEKNYADSVNIIFRNDVNELISHTGHIIVAVDEEKLWFREAEKEIGYKMSRGKKSNTNRYTRIRNKKLAQFVKYHSGDYELKFDKQYKMYYVDCE